MTAPTDADLLTEEERHLVDAILRMPSWEVHDSSLLLARAVERLVKRVREIEPELLRQYRIGYLEGLEKARLIVNEELDSLRNLAGGDKDMIEAGEVFASQIIDLIRDELNGWVDPRLDAKKESR